jgi:Heparinase II/III-like protein/Heparinase II/III N-terminus
LLKRLSQGVADWRRLGPRDGTVAAVRLVGRTVLGPAREARLRVAPLRVGSAELQTALGGLTPAEALRGPALAALPTVSAFERRVLAEASPSLFERADAIVSHRFDLLGSGPVELGPEIDWQLDFKSGRRWPLAHISRVPVVYGDGSDIKVPWELSRFQHLPLLAAAYRVSDERRYLDELGAQLKDWIEHNPVEFGANWVTTMDVAIRAANWVAALALCAEDAAAEPWLEPVLGNLLLHGRFIRSHLEWGPVRGNHYLSDVVGLLPVAALFSNGPEGRDWVKWAADELVAEMEHQVRSDGCDHEMSTSYHRLVCELFVCGTQAVDALVPGRMPDGHRERLGLMLDFVSAYSRPDGLAPQIGDADDGRFLPLDDYGQADQRSHLHLFDQAEARRTQLEGSTAFRAGGYYVIRAGVLYVIVRCGDTGMQGHGGHSHNDQLAFELSFASQPLVIDPGAFIYTPDPDARNLFRSTAFHSTLQIAGAEQNDLAEGLFLLPDRTRAETLVWEANGDRAAFEGQHYGYEALVPPALHRRRIEVEGDSNTVRIRDVVSGGAHELVWSFPLAPCTVTTSVGRAVADFDDCRLEIEIPTAAVGVDEGWYSPSYGIRVQVPLVRARRMSSPGEDVTELILRITSS